MDKLNLWSTDVEFMVLSYELKIILDKNKTYEVGLSSAVIYWPRETPIGIEDELMRLSGLSEKDCMTLYNEFIHHAFPSVSWNMNAFVDYMFKISYSREKSKAIKLFRALVLEKTNYLNFPEFLLGVAAMESQTPHSGVAEEIRCGYIFRYYDINLDGYLNLMEMEKFVEDILCLMNKSTKHELVIQELSKVYKKIGLNMGDPISKSIFIKSLSSDLFRETDYLNAVSKLLRGPADIMKLVSGKKIYPTSSMSSNTPTSNRQISAVSNKQQNQIEKMQCTRCKTKNYHLAVHVVKFTQSRVLDPVSLKLDSHQNVNDRVKQMSELCILGYCNRVIDTFLNMLTLHHNDPDNADLSDDAKVIIKLCNKVSHIFSKEPRCLKIESPCFVLGSITSSMDDLLNFEKILWPKAPISIFTNILFLGNYVSYGCGGLNCLLYLFSMKNSAPHKFHLLRGSSEFRSMKSRFKMECVCKFGRNQGDAIWEACHKAFDSMPVCATVDDSIFCVHSGIPRTNIKITDLDMPNPLTDLSVNHDIWDLMTATPEAQTKTKIISAFSMDQLNKFLSTNKLTHIIRSTQSPDSSYKLDLDNKVITIVSTSLYSNPPSIAFIDSDKIRVILMEMTKKT